jgi:hypothetical protein
MQVPGCRARNRPYPAPADRILSQAGVGQLSQSVRSAAYTHNPLNQEVTAIGGSYLLVKEECLRFQGRQVLYLIGHAIFDSTCCGIGGCAYALVPGFVLDWRSSTDQEGLAISHVAPIRDPAVQDRVRQLIEAREVIQQVLFQ